MLSRLLRIAKTGFSFALFGLGGLSLSLIVFPLTYLLVPKRALKSVCQRQISFLFRCFIKVLSGLNLIRYQFIDFNKLTPTGLIVANHPSLIDIIFLIGWVPNSTCVVKDSLFRNPFTFGPVRCAGYISNADQGFTERVNQALKDGQRVIMFPEGTRTLPNTPLRFLRGASHSAIASQAQIQPIKISVIPPTLGKHESWWQVPSRTPEFSLTAYDAWPATTFPSQGSPSAQARALTKTLVDFYSEFKS